MKKKIYTSAIPLFLSGFVVMMVGPVNWLIISYAIYFLAWVVFWRVVSSKNEQLKKRTFWAALFAVLASVPVQAILVFICLEILSKGSPK